jgi:hypothetical protein
MPDWYCPVCSERLSYGIYCKKCDLETSFAMRPAGELERLIEAAKQLPNPRPVYPEGIDD